MFFTRVCQSVHRGRGYFMMSLPVSMPGPMFLPWKRVSVSGSMFLLAAVSVSGPMLLLGVSVSGPMLFLGVSVSGAMLLLGFP